MKERIYLDNSATSFPKPEAVTEAMVDFARNCEAPAARVASPKRQDVLAPGKHACTTGGNPLCAAALPCGMEEGLLVCYAQAHVLRLAPPVNTPDELLEKGLEILFDVLKG